MQRMWSAWPTLVVLSSLLAAPGNAAEPDRCGFMVDDFFVRWRSDEGATVTWRGLPLLRANPSELIVHRAWEDVYYRSNQSEQTATLAHTDDGATLTIHDRSEQFRWEKRIIAHADGRLRLEYEYELLEPAQAELQVLFGIGRPWLHESDYRAVIGGQERSGELSEPESGRTDPWSDATEQVFETDYGTLSIRAERGLNLLCRPSASALWWAQALERGTVYRVGIDFAIEPGPAGETGVALSGLEWSHTVRDGVATFSLAMAQRAGGPERVRVHARAAGGGEAGTPVEVALADEPRSVRCSAPVAGRGERKLELVIADAASGEELLALGPLDVEVDPYLRVMPRLSLYTHEREGELLVRVAEDLPLDGLSVLVHLRGTTPQRHPVTAHDMRLPLDLTGLQPGDTQVRCQLLAGDDVLAAETTRLRTAAPQANEVKIDHVSGGLIADGLPFIPFGFYTYYPLREGVMDEEVVRGFTLFSPYHRGPHDAEDLAHIREYMDRCAAIGMRVNYHLMWANRPELTDEQWRSLRAEVEAFRDHPALLSWYIADEPSADRAAILGQVYALVSELDPHHPVTIVFYRGGAHARRFEQCLDIVMGDPYPIPHNSVTYVSRMSDELVAAYDGRKPLWIVPQAFGGNEWWRREPTAQEQRVMTWLALIHGARGIQYFIRSPRISFPKSPIMWAECGALALETAELTPALTSAEPRPEVTCAPDSVHVAAFRDRGVVTVLAVNTRNEPQALTVRLPGIEWSGEAEVVFENRTIAVAGGVIAESIDAFDTRAYRLPVGPLPEDDLAIDPANLTINPSWEQVPSAGTPSGCYADIGPGATAFVDARLARHGRHCLRLTLPDADSTVRLRPFPFRVEGGRTYRVSIWGRALQPGVRLRLALGQFGEESFELSGEWREYAFEVTPDADASRAGLALALETPGTAWLDLLQVVPVAEQ